MKFITSIGMVDANCWNELVGTDYPFIRHEFLYALESTGAVCTETGWSVKHLLVYQQDELVGLMPLYIKEHSYGEYVFDFQWANAYHQSGVQYYPKLLSAIPFTPCTGKRICIAEGHSQVKSLILHQIIKLGEEIGASSFHLLFPNDDNDWLQQSHLAKRIGAQYHWFNQQYQDFDAFLATLKMKQRKNIRRERNAIVNSQVVMQVLKGEQIDQQLWNTFYKFYQQTYLKRSGNIGYLNPEFFIQMGESMASRVMMVVAKKDSNTIAASLFLKGEDTLYGRYWGSLEEYNFIHFEACYYQGIEYCIKHNIARFDAGAQGEHKISRGFKPVETQSLHWIKDKPFRHAINEFLAQERPLMKSHIEQLKLSLPYKKPNNK